MPQVEEDSPYGKCLITREQADSLDYDKFKSACDPSASLDSRCTACLCAFGEVRGP